MFAIIETGGKQIKVTEEEIVKVEKINAKEGDNISIDKVLLISDGNNVSTGTPYIESAHVNAEVVSSGKDKKVLVFKMKPRKGYRRLRGHRQHYSLLKIKEITSTK